MLGHTPPPPPLNRLSHQIARDGHLTFNKKCRDLLLQIFGHEGLIDNKDTADIAHCTFLDEDFYRMSTLRWEHFALRKLLNPFKWIEFLLTAPLEILSWGVGRLTGLLGKLLKENLALIPNRYLRFGLAFIRNIFRALLSIAFPIVFPIVNIAVNLITGVLRRFLAPVRYIIRPAIETSRKYPKSFYAIVAISLGVGVALAVTVLTGGLPAILGGLFFAGSLALKLTVVSTAATALGALLTKGFNTLCELVGAVKSNRKALSGNEQMRGVDERNQQLNYSLYLLKTDQEPNKDDLDKESQSKPPLLIKHERKVFIYGRSGSGGTQLIELENKYENKDDFERLYTSVSQDAKENQICELNKETHVSDDLMQVYEDINIVRGHIPEKTGSTDKVTEALHAIDLAHTEVLPVDKQNKWYTTALVTGTESIFFHKKTPANLLAENKPKHNTQCSY